MLFIKRVSLQIFMKLLRLNDLQLEIHEQRHDTLKSKRFQRLAELAIKSNLKTVLRALIHPTNIPHSPLMCSLILQADRHIDFDNFENGYLDYIQALEICKCLKDHQTFVKESSLKTIEVMCELEHEFCKSFQDENVMNSFT